MPAQHPARFIWQVLSSLDFSGLETRYVSVRVGAGRPPYHPRLLAALWIYGMTQGLETAAAIARACAIRDDFRWLAGGLSPSDQTLLNFLTGSEAGLASIWTQVLKAMHQAGHIDLSAIAEDGTKLRANASPRSFHVAADIEAVIGTLEAEITATLKQATESTEEPPSVEAERKGRGLRLRLCRAKRAAEELEQRARGARGRVSHPPGDATQRQTIDATDASAWDPTLDDLAKGAKTPLFAAGEFRPAPDRDVLVCPNDQELRFIGEYRTPNGRRTYRLYGRNDCGGCPVKVQCTRSRGRRVKLGHDIPRDEPSGQPHFGDDQALPIAHTIAPDQPPSPSPPASLSPPQEVNIDGVSQEVAPHEEPGGPRASITEPEAVMMLATSEKRWEPSYNADLAVTRHGIIVSQFLTKNPTDFAHFRSALPAVLSAVGKPESWVGDGHYGTMANVVLADRAGVFLYAPPAWSPISQADSAPADPAEGASTEEHAHGQPTNPSDQPNAQFTRHDFRLDPARRVLVCPAEQELSFVGEYPTANRLSTYQLYHRPDCADCSQKGRCTKAKGRRVKIPVHRSAAQMKTTGGNDGASDSKLNLLSLLGAHEQRMNDVGDAALSFRRETIEPLNAHLKQHGLGRFHVHGLARCQAVLTLASIGHNVTKWRAREIARSLKAAA